MLVYVMSKLGLELTAVLNFSKSFLNFEVLFFYNITYYTQKIIEIDSKFLKGE